MQRVLPIIFYFVLPILLCEVVKDLFMCDVDLVVLPLIFDMILQS